MYSALIISNNNKLVHSIENYFLLISEYQSIDKADSLFSAQALLTKNIYHVLVVVLESETNLLVRWLKNYWRSEIELIIIHNSIPVNNLFFDFNLRAYIGSDNLASDLKVALQRIKKIINTKFEIQTRIENLIKINSKNPYTTIAFQTATGTELIEIREIIAICAAKNSAIICLKGNKELKTSRSITDMDKLLYDLDFFRIHRSFMVNLSHVKKYKKRDGGSVEMSDNSIFPISIGKKTDFLKKLKNSTLNLF